MALEIRPYREEEIRAFRRVPEIVFGNYAGEDRVPQQDVGMGIGPEWSLCAFEDGQLATTYGAFPLVMRLNGEITKALTCADTIARLTAAGHTPAPGTPEAMLEYTRSEILKFDKIIKAAGMRLDG